jgi:aromatic ring-opening dioxygenase catalytic subunit (LigB family)
MAARMPVLFLSHGGGPWPWVDGMREAFAVSAREFAKLPQLLPDKPRAILVVSGHWEESEFTLATASHPPTIYDYSGFPPHTYELEYPAPGAPELATHVLHLLRAAGITVHEDPSRGYDHGVFVPLFLMYPQAEVPVLMLSMKHGYDPAEHIRLGQALAPLREEGVLIVGSGLTYHNMRGFGRAEATAPAATFESYLNAAISAPDAAHRNGLLEHWEGAPAARLAHPREDHLVPLFVIAGAAGEERGRRVFTDQAMNVTMASYVFGA